MRQVDIDEQLPQLGGDAPGHAWVSPTMSATHVNLWAGSGGTVTGIHTASYENVLTQLRGQKEVMLAPPSAFRSVYMQSLDLVYFRLSGVAEGGDSSSARLGFERRSSRVDAQRNRSPVDYLAPNASLHPMWFAAEAERSHCVLDEGDALFIPAFWWHAVTSVPNPADCSNVATNSFYSSTQPYPHPAYSPSQSER